MVREVLQSILSSGSSLQPDARRIGDYIDSKFSDLDKARLARALLQSIETDNKDTFLLMYIGDPALTVVK